MPVLGLFKNAHAALNQVIPGQPALTEGLLLATLAGGHVLIEGPPGVAKTRAAKALAACLGVRFRRIQFTPDLMPGDITGTEVYRPQDGRFEFEPGPLFHELILADEVNRAPARVQSALLEAMAEGQITVGGQSRTLPHFFLVMATQNPMDLEGTHPLPEAQLDRFMLQLRVGYPSEVEEQNILTLVRQEFAHHATARLEDTPLPLAAPVHAGVGDGGAAATLAVADLLVARQAVAALFMAPHVSSYLLTLVRATREPERHVPALKGAVQWGASPRAAIALERAARARAWLHGRDYVSPEDVQALAHDVLRHRLVLSFAARAEGQSPASVLSQLLAGVPLP